MWRKNEIPWEHEIQSDQRKNLQRPIEKMVISCNWHQARENSNAQVPTGYNLASDRVGSWCESFRLIKQFYNGNAMSYAGLFSSLSWNESLAPVCSCLSRASTQIVRDITNDAFTTRNV